MSRQQQTGKLMSVIENIIDIPAEYEKTVFGQFDYNIKKIEKTLHVTIISRDGDLKIIGGETTTKRAKSVFNQLIELAKEEMKSQNKMLIMHCL